MQWCSSVGEYGTQEGVTLGPLSLLHSVFLGTLGYKVANCPVLPDVDLPSVYEKVDRMRVFGLTVEPDVLTTYRQVPAPHQLKGGFRNHLCFRRRMRKRGFIPVHPIQPKNCLLGGGPVTWLHTICSPCKIEFFRTVCSGMSRFATKCVAVHWMNYPAATRHGGSFEGEGEPVLPASICHLITLNARPTWCFTWIFS